MTAKLTADEVRALVAELGPLLEGSALLDAASLPPRDLLLVLEPPARDGVLRLRLSADPDAPRVHLQHERVKKHSGGTGPFYRRVAADLAGATLTRIGQPQADRLVHIAFRGGPNGDRGLVAELTGRHANLVLLDRDDGVLELLVPPPKAKDRAPRLVVGKPWAAPPGRPPERLPGTPPTSEPDAPAPLPEPPTLAGLAPVSWRVEYELGGAALDHSQARQRRDLRERLTRRRKRARSALKGLERRRAAAEDAERVRQDGELLKAHLGQLARGAREVRLPDYYAEGAPERRLELDPKRSPADNVERLFARARKLERSLAELPREEARATARLAALEDLLARLEDPATDPAELEAHALAERLLDAPQQSDPRKRVAPPPRLPYRVFRTSADGEVRVGRNARDNDALSFRHARGNDLWLHTADAPGSHVVLRVERGAEPAEEDVVDACHLAVHFSPLRGARRANVHVARCKELRKPKGAPAGLVLLAGGRTRSVRIDEERLRQLLDRRPDAPPAAPGAPSPADPDAPA